MCADNAPKEEKKVPKDKIIKLPHLGPNAAVTITYKKPTLKDYKELGRERVGVDIIARQCQLCIEVDGRTMDDDWWDKIDADVFAEIVEFLEDSSPPRPKNSVLGAVPLVWGR